jgi:hypothetical protein
MIATTLKWLIIIMSAANTGYMLFDGTRAFVKGDYVRPAEGKYAGQLGPWTNLVEKVGIDPMSSFMKSIFIFFGLVGLFITVCFAINISWSWKALIIYNICSSWYLFFGTASSGAQILLLFILRFIS